MAGWVVMVAVVAELVVSSDVEVAIRLCVARTRAMSRAISRAKVYVSSRDCGLRCL